MNDIHWDRTPLRTVPDLRGTVTEDASGLSVGQLWGALAEADTGLLRYLDLQLARRPRHVLVPIGHARLRETAGVATVRLRAALLEDLESIPAFDAGGGGEVLPDGFEDSLLEAHGRAFHGERYYAHPSFDHTGLFAGEHPIVTQATVPPSEPLQPLRALRRYQVAEGEPDIRGWELCGAGDETVGRIDDLVVDVECEKVRYAAVGLEAESRTVLVPVGYLRVDRSQQVVSAPALRAADALALPGYAGGPVERTDEEATQAALDERLRGRRRYLRPDFDTRAFSLRSDEYLA